jgi:DMSO/TMAO reductase YedYZ heme-binding membrane subunit
MRIPTWTIVSGAALIAAALGVGFMQAFGGWTREGVLAGTAITARWAFPFFIAAWSASSLARLWPGGWRTALLRRRRALGLAFAANHFVHLGFIVAAVGAFGETRPLFVYLLGGGAYLMIAAMALTSNDAAQRWMGFGRWRLLHTIGGWWVFVIFTNSYVSRLMEKPAIAGPAVALIALALTLRIAAALKGRMRAQAA